jgi:aminoglycoside phosphotransferase (APT) family kinase protein
MTESPNEAVLAALDRMGVRRGAAPLWEPLTGGVSSEIWRVTLPDGPICVKRALPKLRVSADWQAPVERNLYEARWMRVAGRIAPGSVPRLLGQDEQAGLLAMEYSPASGFPLWKAILRDGGADPSFAATVGRVLGRIHAATAADPDLAAAFPTDRIFHDIRLEPYLTATGLAHADLAQRIQFLLEKTMANKRALVHGDVSPKNILCGPCGPVFLDAECAWWGDPAFDLAFCLNHLLLKCLWVPSTRPALRASFLSLTGAYLPQVDWEPRESLEARAAHLLPALFLARVDGKSPVEYITADSDRDRVRLTARRLLLAPPDRLEDIVTTWHGDLAA